mmetsp:Transcript_253/g.351  ORF Transcript_253/g.351 Transcript_253/m.351 type:complete len:153 (-) Transcript_253:72-530(-)
MAFLHLMIINKAGGLIYNQNLSPTARNLDSNTWLRLGSTFHSLHAIAAQVAPVASSGIEQIETDAFKLRCFHTLTGLKFVLTAAAGQVHPSLDVVLRQIYELYSDYVLKNPFYETEMPIRIELFTSNLIKLIDSYTNSSISGSKHLVVGVRR